MTSIGGIALHSVGFLVSFPMTSVATVGVDLPASYVVPSQSSCTLYVESVVGVSTLSVGLRQFGNVS
jgi:hypothetical protein